MSKPIKEWGVVKFLSKKLPNAAGDIAANVADVVLRGESPIKAVADVIRGSNGELSPEDMARAVELAEMDHAEYMAGLEVQGNVIVAEAQSESWLAANWRPILMLSFTAIIVNNYILSPYLQAIFGFSVSLEIPVDMWDLLKIGVGGYITGRTIEKGIKIYKSKD